MEDCCLLVYTKPPRAGKVKTRLIGALTPEQAAELHAAFLGDLLERFDGAQYRLRIAWAAEPEEEVPERSDDDVLQLGEDLGARLFHGLSVAAEASYRVAAVGSDHPLLSTARVEEAFSHLQVADVVLGPAADGGYYLVAVRRDSLTRELFRGIDWSTERVLSQTLERCRARGLGVHLLPTESDVDTAADLRWLMGELRRDDDLCPRSRALLNSWFEGPSGVAVS